MIRSQVFQESIRHIYCMSPDDFTKTWGDDGEYLWAKFNDKFNGDVGKFICYLDINNMHMLMAHCDQHYKKCIERGQ